MPTVRRSAEVGASPRAVWRIVSDPRALPSWWPAVERVEDASARAWTALLRSRRARKPVAADFTRTHADPPHELRWRQETDETPFERFLASAETVIRLSPAAEGATTVEIVARRRLRGLARLGAPFVRRATRRQLNAALAGLGAAVAKGRR